MPIPRHTIPENLLPYPQMYWTWERSWFITVTNAETGEQFEFDGDGLVIAYTSQGDIQAIAVGGAISGVRAVSTATLRVGTTWPDDYTEVEQNTLTSVLAMLSFLNSPYVSAEKQRIPRPIRRELARSKVAGVDTEPTIHVVKLREVSTPNGIAHGTGREFRHQWWVRGHIRAQWFPSKKGHNLIWIQEYLKGPPDAPMISKIYDVKR